MKLIEITVAPDGQSRAETKGFAGAECQQASLLLEKALGRRVSEQLTVEFYAQTGIHAQQQEGA